MNKEYSGEIRQQNEVEKSRDALVELFMLVDNESPVFEKENKVADIVSYLRRVGDSNLVRRILDSKYDEINSDGRFAFDPKKRLELKQFISRIRDEFIPKRPDASYQGNVLEIKESLPDSVSMKLVSGELTRNILGRGKKKLVLRSASFSVAVLKKGEQVDNTLKFSEKTGSIFKGGETIEMSFLYDTDSGCIKIYSKDSYSGQERLLDTIMLTGGRRWESKTVNLPDGGHVNINFNW